MLDDVSAPPWLPEASLASVCLWLSVEGTRSSTHYDPRNNLLCVVAGEKAVRLWSPRHTPGMYPKALGGEESNHSSVDTLSPGPADQERHPLFAAAEAAAAVATVRPGDAIFIPEGWWCAQGAAAAPEAPLCDFSRVADNPGLRHPCAWNLAGTR